MANSTGVSAALGSLAGDWSHVQQSVAKILTTPLGSRVMRRDFGSAITDLIDAKMTSGNVLAIYAAAAVAIEKWEPRFRVSRARIGRVGADGVIAMELFGLYFPLGHRGNFDVAEDASTRVVFTGA